MFYQVVMHFACFQSLSRQGCDPLLLFLIKSFLHNLPETTDFLEHFFCSQNGLLNAQIKAFKDTVDPPNF